MTTLAVHQQPTRPARLRAKATTMIRRARLLSAIVAGRAEFHLLPRTRSFLGAYGTYAEAQKSTPPWALTGYDHYCVADIAFDAMCQVAIWDYPVLFWLKELDPSSVLDAGGHMGTKFRAFDPHLRLRQRVRWTVFETPSLVKAGRERAIADSMSDDLSFVDNINLAPEADLLLVSGLMQYFDGSLGDLLDPIATKPPNILLNKVATRDGPALVTLERIGQAFVPYQIREERILRQEIADLGYDIVDEWTIPSLAHKIRSHPEFGLSTSRGFYLTRTTIGKS